MQAHGGRRKRRNSKGGYGAKRSPKIRAQKPTETVPECKLEARTTTFPRLQLPDVPAHQRGICACDAVAWMVLAALLIAYPM